MRKVKVFNHVSLDGYFCDAKNDMSWAHQNDAESNEFAARNAGGTDSALVFGRVTYDMMASYWPTPAAMKQAPKVAEGMNSREKIVFSRKMKKASWENTTLINSDPVAAIRKLKAKKGDDLVLMGSGTIISLLAAKGLVDEFQLVIHPLVLGSGRTLFETVKKPFTLERTESKTFKNGNIVATYVLAK